MKNIAIIGAGFAGLAAARELQSRGYGVTVFEEARIAGGRAGSRHHGTLVFDHGAQNCKTEGTSLEEFVRESVPSSEIVEIRAPVLLHNGHALLPGDPRANAERKWTCRGGLARLAKTMGQDLDIRFARGIRSLRQEGDTIALIGQGNKIHGVADAVVIAIPVPQAVEVLEQSDVASEDLAVRLTPLRKVSYSQCLSVLLHYEYELDVDWYALLAQDRQHPLLWLARENAKGESFVPGGSGTALVAQLGPAWSREHFDYDDDRIVNRCGQWIAALVGDDFREPEWSYVKRWRYAQPIDTADFSAVNPPRSRIVIAGDGVSRARIPDAYECGLRAARHLLAG